MNIFQDSPLYTKCTQHISFIIIVFVLVIVVECNLRNIIAKNQTNQEAEPMCSG